MINGNTIFSSYLDNSNGGTTDICGNPTPIFDSINTNYNDIAITVNVSIPHTSSTLSLSMISNLLGTSGAWGIRELNITMEACD